MTHYEMAEEALARHDYGYARKCLGYARRENPGDFRIWFGFARVITCDFTRKTMQNWIYYSEYAKSLTTPDNVAVIDRTLAPYCRFFEPFEIEKLRTGAKKKLERDGFRF